MPSLTLEQVLERVAALKAIGQFGPLKEELGSPADDLAAEIATILQDPQIRREHRSRIYDDLLANRSLLAETRNPQFVQLMFWGEHVEGLYTGRSRGHLQVFHYARAMEATCKRCGLDFIRAISRMEELGKLWSGRDYAGVLRLLAPPA
ncbi:MAG: hypothetical protein ACT4PV_05225 [Planctomycetaceae bacterium]